MRQDTVIIRFLILLSLTALCHSITPLSSIAESGSTTSSFPWTICHPMTVDSTDQGTIDRQSWNPAWVVEGMPGGGIKPQGPWPEITAGTWPSPSVPCFSVLTSVHKVYCNSFLAGTPYCVVTHGSPHHGELELFKTRISEVFSLLKTLTHSLLLWEAFLHGHRAVQAHLSLHPLSVGLP